MRGVPTAEEGPVDLLQIRPNSTADNGAATGAQQNWLLGMIVFASVVETIIMF